MIPIPVPNIEPTYYLPIGGTGHSSEGWVVNNDDLFTLFMRARNFEPVRPKGQPWMWSGKLAVWNDREWRLWANALQGVLSGIPFEQRNIFAHSHGGTIAIMAAANGAEIRTLTTFGTPNRRDIQAPQAVTHIRYWQHIYDKDRDWMASLRRTTRRTLGQLGDWSWSQDRSFAEVAGLRRVPLEDISHSKLLRDPTCFHWLDDLHVLDYVKAADGPRDPATEAA